MTHSMHRSGTRKSLDSDYVLFIMPAYGINDMESGLKVRKFLEIALRHNPVMVGDCKRGNMYALDIQNILDNINRDGTVVHAVFDNENALGQAIMELKEADLGLSLIVSGLFDRVKHLCQNAGIHRHAVMHSLGIWGRTEKLPADNTLDIVTMCGHGMVSAGLVESLAEDVKTGRKSAEDAAKEMGRQCQCGAFNPVRATRLLMTMVGVK